MQNVHNTSDIYCLSIPIPVPLKYVNCYLVHGQQGWTIIDTGFHNEDAKTAWNAAFKALHIGPSDICSIVITHANPDHLGAAGWLQECTGAPVFISQKELEMLKRRWFRGHDWALELVQYLIPYGLPESRKQVLFEWEMSGIRMSEPFPSHFKVLVEDDYCEIGDRRLRVKVTPGHSLGHMVLVDETDGLAFVGDQVLSNITPHIGQWESTEENALRQYLHSLHKLCKMQIEYGLSGHRDSITNWKERISQISLHHAKRLDSLGMAASEGYTAWEVTLKGFKLNGFVQYAFAFTETVAHLEYLVEGGWLKRKEKKGVYEYYQYRHPS